MGTVSSEKLISLMFASMRSMREEFHGKEHIDPFSMLRLETLRFIIENGQPSMRQVADHLRIVPASATSLINDMVASGHLQRSSDPADRRLVRLAATVKGKKMVEEKLKFVAARMRIFLKPLGPAERAQFARILIKLTSKKVKR